MCVTKYFVTRLSYDTILYCTPILYQTNYTKGQYYRPHYDNIEKYNVRIKTFIIYLSDNYTGGYTSFPLLQKKFKLKKGSALIFDNLNKNNKVQDISSEEHEDIL